MATKRAALYVRVSTDKQTVENQVRELTGLAQRRGWEVVATYNDAGISGAKGRDQRPGLDTMLKDASRGQFEVVMAWAIDRLGRSLDRSLGHNPDARSLQGRRVYRATEPRYHQPNGQAAVPDNGRLRRV